MLARLATTLRERQAVRVGVNPGGEDEGGTIVLDENCTVSSPTYLFLGVLLYSGVKIMLLREANCFSFYSTVDVNPDNSIALLAHKKVGPRSLRKTLECCP